MNKKDKPLFIFNIIIFSFYIISLIIFILSITKTEMLTKKYLMIILSILGILSLIYLICILFLKKKHKILIVIDMLFVFIGIALLVSSFKIKEVYTFLNDNLSVDTEIVEYDIIINSNHELTNINDLSGLSIPSPSDSTYKDELESELLKVANIKTSYDNDSNTLIEGVMNNTYEYVILKSAEYDAMIDLDETIKNSTKILYTLSFEVKVDDEEVDIDISEEPFLLYVAGIDTREDSVYDNCLTDVNMLLAVNPKTKQILMVHIPRDYYVQLPGTTGLKDKLTHAGIRGGTKLSIATIEDIMGVDIDYYVKVNFHAVINLVDSIGGITVYNELNHSFKCFTDNSCTIKPGNNNVNGKCALAFARERYAYSTGDVHRGQNQQQVIEKILEKVGSSKTFISNYQDIMKAVDGTFITNLKYSDISSLVKMELEDMDSWTITKYSVTGYDGFDYTYSWPKQKTYVMIQNPDKLEEAKNLINDVLGK